MTTRMVCLVLLLTEMGKTKKKKRTEHRAAVAAKAPTTEKNISTKLNQHNNNNNKTRLLLHRSSGTRYSSYREPNRQHKMLKQTEKCAMTTQTNGLTHINMKKNHFEHRILQDLEKKSSASTESGGVSNPMQSPIPSPFFQTKYTFSFELSSSCVTPYIPRSSTPKCASILCLSFFFSFHLRFFFFFVERVISTITIKRILAQHITKPI